MIKIKRADEEKVYNLIAAKEDLYLPVKKAGQVNYCLLYTSPSPRD